MQPVLASPVRAALQALLGCAAQGGNPQQRLKAALENSESSCVEARAKSAAAFAPTVALAMRHGAHIVPCAVLGSAGGGGGWDGFALAAACATLGFGPRPGGVAVVCAAPVRLPFTETPTQALVMEYAEGIRAAAAKALVEHSEAFFGGEKKK